jgi:NAD(P)-dependent dehydrogenase (short-subunit alcohol dehydrogenase family)
MGFATAQQFISEGATVIITGRSQKNLDSALKELGPSAKGFVSDSGKMADLLELPARISEHATVVDVLYVNAGYGKFAPVEAVDEVQFDELFNLLVKGTFFTVQQVLPFMKEGSAIVLNTSVVTEYGSAGFSVYPAAKSAVKSFIKSFAAEFLPKGIRVNGVSPGYIATNIFNNTGLTPEQIEGAVSGITPTLPMKRFGTPEEIAAAVLFLASDEASYIHGAELAVDGGLSVIR